jgi:diguanylate cyclase (GGDEF)-like protein/PAS domain S-box-containing protein
MTAIRRNVARRVKRTIGNVYFESLFNKVPEAIALCDNRGFVIRINHEFRQMFGYTQAEACGRLIDDLVAPETLRLDAATLTQATARGEVFATEAVRQRQDGTQLQVSIIGAPILVHGKRVALYGIYRNISDRKAAEQALLESQRQAMETYAALQQRTRQLEEANTRLEKLSNLDGLTAIPNRRYFENLYQTEWRRACREKAWLSLIMIDVDFFKSFNDHHGHLTGDDCLKRIAQALSEKNRAGDLVARYGGEEFVALLTSNTRQGALQAAERMRLRVKELEIEHGHSSVSPHVTVSLGLASQKADAEAEAMDLLRKADEALYLAKTRGRDRVEVAES